MEKPNKKIIILKHPKGARLANQLWNFVSVYAYCIEMNYECKNYSFFEDKRQHGKANSIDSYYKYFDFPASKYLNFLFKINFILNTLSAKFRPYYRYVEFIEKYYSNKILSDDKSAFYLPPSKNNDKKQMVKLNKFENSKDGKLYFDGWLFRNPTGLKKYHKEIVEYFKPKKYVSEYVNDLISPIRGKYNHIIGVHMRQSDYKKLFENGEYYFNEKEVRKILDDYLQFSNRQKESVMFVICSDEKIDETYFEGLSFTICNGSTIEDLFTLASCDAIIGSNSTFGVFAAYYGNIPILCFNRAEIDWKEFRNMKSFEYYNNCTLVQQ